MFLRGAKKYLPTFSQLPQSVVLRVNQRAGNVKGRKSTETVFLESLGNQIQVTDVEFEHTRLYSHLFLLRQFSPILNVLVNTKAVSSI